MTYPVIKPEQLSQTVSDLMREYGNEVSKTTKKVCQEIGKEALKVVKQEAPIGRRKGAYKKHIALKTMKDDFASVTQVIYVKPPETGLAHLLEYGHMTQKGGTTTAKPHFAAGEKYANENFEKRIREELEGS